MRPSHVGATAIWPLSGWPPYLGCASQPRLCTKGGRRGALRDILLIEMLATAGSYMIQEFLRFDVEALHEPETQVSEPSGLDL